MSSLLLTSVCGILLSAVRVVKASVVEAENRGSFINVAARL
jgi:hypothetical protein